MRGPVTREAVGIALLIVVATSAVYFQVRTHDFVNLDDYTGILENPRFLSGFSVESVQSAFVEPYQHNWIPLNWISLHVDYVLYGREAGGYLLTNVALHILSALLLFGFLLRTTGAVWCSGFTGLVFAVHPLHVESVAWVSERKDVLSGLFFMLTLWAHARYAEGPARWRRFAPVVIFLALGLLSKPMLVTLPFVLLLVDFWPLGRVSDASGERLVDPERLRRLAIEKLPLLAIVIAAAAITYAVQSATGAVASLDRLPLGDRVANALQSYVVYLSQTLLPRGLAVLYPYPASPDWAAAGAAALLLVGATVVAIYRAREQPYLIVGWLWFVGMLVPVVGIVQVGLQAHADRYMYLPQIGLCIAIAWAAADAVGGSRSARLGLAAVAALLVAWFGSLAWQQTHHWRDTLALYQRALAVTEDNYLAHRGLADALMLEQRVGDAQTHYAKAAELRPGWSEAELGMADTLAAQGRLGEALPIYERWMEASPDSARPVGSLGLALLRKGRFEEAHARLEAGLRLDPYASELWAGLGIALAGLGNHEESIAAYREALRLEPGQPTASNNLAWMLATAPDASLRDPAEAVRVAEAAIRRTPNDPPLLDTLAAAYAAAGRFGDASKTAERAAWEAEQRGATGLAAQIRHRAELYRAGRSYVEAR
jgi:tetratricopeptide (TPR) repeat protein